MKPFDEERMKSTSNEILKNLQRIQGKDDYTLLHDFFILSAIYIRNNVDNRPTEHEKYESRYHSISKNYSKDELMIMASSFGMLYKEYEKMMNGDRAFTDLCGEIYMSSNTSNGKAGQYFTPYCVSQMCAISAIDADEAKAKIESDSNDVISVLEPSCGAGGMLVAAAERLQQIGINYAYNSIMYGVDIDERCVAMSYIQCSLLGIPAIITHGNALTLETFGEWETPAFIFNFLHFNQHRRKSIEILQTAKDNQAQKASDACDGSGNEMAVAGENVARTGCDVPQSKTNHQTEFEQLTLF